VGPGTIHIKGEKKPGPPDQQNMGNPIKKGKKNEGENKAESLKKEPRDRAKSGK